MSLKEIKDINQKLTNKQCHLIRVSETNSLNVTGMLKDIRITEKKVQEFLKEKDRIVLKVLREVFDPVIKKIEKVGFSDDQTDRYVPQHSIIYFIKYRGDEYQIRLEYNNGVMDTYNFRVLIHPFKNRKNITEYEILEMKEFRVNEDDVEEKIKEIAAFINSEYGYFFREDKLKRLI